jgi:hypothetical protein
VQRSPQVRLHQIGPLCLVCLVVRLSTMVRWLGQLWADRYVGRCNCICQRCLCCYSPTESQLSADSHHNTSWCFRQLQLDGFRGRMDMDLLTQAPLTGATPTRCLLKVGLQHSSRCSDSRHQGEVYRGANRTNAVSDVTVKLLKAGVAVGSNKAAAGFWPQILWNAYNIPTGKRCTPPITGTNGMVGN